MQRPFLIALSIAVSAVAASAVAIGSLFFFWPMAIAGLTNDPVVIPAGASAREVAAVLKEEGYIPSELLFTLYARFSGRADQLKAGTFSLAHGDSIPELIGVLTEATSSERRITLLEGWGIREMGEYLVAQGALKSVDEWYAAVGTPPSVAGPKRQIPGSLSASATFDTAHTLEGILFPDTYRIALDATAEDIAKKMLNNFTERMQEIPSRADATYETIILASIIEREVRSDEDRKIVADLFQRRLEEGMALQADSTVNYVTGKKTPSLSINDRDIDSPWNTYQHRGLPPTPISNPSLSAIKAVLDPTPNTYVYFLTDNEGAVHYARTFAEHVANKERYLR